MQALLAAIVCNVVLKAGSVDVVNDRPIIGIVVEQTNSTLVPDAKSKIYASYIKFIEAGGGRVVPIWNYKPIEYYEDIMNNINGVLFPGGNLFLRSKGYGRTGRIILKIASKMNEMGDYFPLWGTCLGFELLNYLAVKANWMKDCAAEDLATNIQFVKGFNDSKLFQDLDCSLRNEMHKKNVAIHYHQWCFTLENYTLSGLDKYFKVLALNQDSRNTTFVSIVEAYNYPFYGVAFHPEKVMFEWGETKRQRKIPHNLDAVRISQYFTNFFVNEARKSIHHFPNKKAEDDVLIYNYNPVFTGRRSTPTQNYYFTQ